MANYAPLKQWEFFIEDENMNQRVLLTKFCKKPANTKFWANMQRWLSDNPFADFKVYRIGYRLKVN